jgi:integrase
MESGAAPAIDLRWQDLRHEGACRRLADGVNIRIIQLMPGHASIQHTQRYLNVTDEELRRGVEVSWNNKRRPRRRQPKADVPYVFAAAAVTQHGC